MSTQVNITSTANGDKAYSSSGTASLDFFFHAAAKRMSRTLETIPAMFSAAYSENKAHAAALMFYLRDIRGGQGEREAFRKCLKTLHTSDLKVFNTLIPLVAEYGRWDDLVEYVDNPEVTKLVMQQLSEDFANMAAKKPISLLAKWMPSINTSSKKTVELARKWRKAMSISEATYRKNLSALRAYLNVVEVAMSAGKWTDINYSSVPSRAAMKYRKAFLNRDAARYTEFLTKVQKGEAKIHATTLFPYDIVSKMLNGDSSETLELLWKSLPNYCDTPSNALVVADVSGSMFGGPLEVAISLALYISERNTGQFKDTFITFSEHPELQVITGNTLQERVSQLRRADWDMNTNLAKVFDIILSSAVTNKLPQSELPETLFIVSDMQFDQADRNGRSSYEDAKDKFEAAGYRLPKLVFWNVRSVGTQTPISMDDSGVYLVSGNSPSIYPKVINTTTINPMDLMLEVITSDRYSPVISAVLSTEA